MPQFRINVEETTNYCYVVEAKDMEEAKEKVMSGDEDPISQCGRNPEIVWEEIIE